MPAELQVTPKMIFYRRLNQPSFCNAEVDRVEVVSLGFRVQMRRLFCVGVAKRHRTRLSQLVSHMRPHVLFRFNRDRTVLKKAIWFHLLLLL